MCFISELPPNADIKLFYIAAVEDKETLERELKEAKVMFLACQFILITMMPNPKEKVEFFYSYSCFWY